MAVVVAGWLAGWLAVVVVLASSSTAMDVQYQHSYYVKEVLIMLYRECDYILRKWQLELPSWDFRF